MATYILKRLLWKLFSGIGRSGYPNYYDPTDYEINNPNDLPILFDVKPLGVFEEDYSKLTRSEKNRVLELIKSLKLGYVYENNPDDPDEYTHARPRADYGKWKIFSKDVDHRFRFIYGIANPKIQNIGGIQKSVVPVRMFECIDHDNDFENKEKNNGNWKQKKVVSKSLLNLK